MIPVRREAPDAPPTNSPAGPPAMEGETGAASSSWPGRRAVALIVAVVLVLSGNATALVLVDRGGEMTGAVGAGNSPDPAPATTVTPAPSTTVTAPPTTSTPTTEPSTPLQRTVAELSAFVAGQRELEFLRPVEVELLADEAFVARLLDGVEEERAETDASERVLRALKLLEPGVDLFDTFLAFYGNAVIGFYDPETDQLVLRGSELSPYVRTTLVHELAHALDDQHFELHRPEINDADDESSLAFSSLIEGVALAVEAGYRDTLSAEEEAHSNAEAADFSRRTAGAPIPAIVTSLVQFPYLAGPTFVEALLDEGGEARIDVAFQDPPTTSEQILEPDVYLRDEEPRQVAAPGAGGAVIEEGTYGQWALYLTLSEVMPGDEASRAASGWGGDSYVAWDEGDRTCVRMSFAMDTAGDLSELDAAWRRWARAHGDASVDAAGDLVTVTACG